MRGTKKYLVPAHEIHNTLEDLAQIQNGGGLEAKKTDRTRFIITMYGLQWEIAIDVLDTGDDRCSVTIEAMGEERAMDRLIYRQFSLLDALLIARAKDELKNLDKAP